MFWLLHFFRNTVASDAAPLDATLKALTTCDKAFLLKLRDASLELTAHINEEINKR